MVKVNLQDKYIKKVETTPNNIFLLRVSYVDQKTEEEGVVCGIHKTIGGKRIISLPRNSKEEKIIEKAVAETTNWFEITDPETLKNFCSYNSPIKKGKCSVCQKEKEIVTLPFKRTVQGKQYNVTEQEKKEGNDFCYLCLRELRVDITQTDRINRIHAGKDEENVIGQVDKMTAYMAIIERLFEEFEAISYPRTCIFCSKNETEKILAQGKEYDYAVSSAKLDIKEVICDDCFRIIKRAQGEDKVKIAKIVTEKVGREWVHEYHCEDCLEIVNWINEFRNSYNLMFNDNDEERERDLLGKTLIEKITNYKKEKGSLCENGDKYLSDAYGMLKK